MEWLIVVLWILSPLAGMFAGLSRQAGYQGFMLGLVFGPLGVIAALGVDNRRECRSCGTQFNEGAKLCPACRESLAWHLPKFES